MSDPVKVLAAVQTLREWNEETVRLARIPGLEDELVEVVDHVGAEAGGTKKLRYPG